MTPTTDEQEAIGLGQFWPAAVVLALWVLWIGANGGYFSSTWYPSAIAAVALLVITISVRRQALPHHRHARVALAAFGALVALSYLSMLWSDAPASALETSNELLLYLAVGWVFSILPWTPRVLLLLIGAWVIGIATFCALGLVQATSATRLDPFFVQLRYAIPLHYPNATAALAVMAMWPALIISARRELPVALRALFLAVGVFLAEFALLPQSRAALVGLIATTPLVLAFSSDRLRMLTRMAIVGGALAFSVPRTVAVDDTINASGHVGPVLAHAASGMLVSTLIAFVIGGLLAITELRWSARKIRPRRRLRLARRGKLVIAVAAILVGAAGVAAAAPPVSHFVRTVWRNGHTDASTGSTRLLSTTPEERFDYARVAIDLFVDAPVLGVGAGNFGRHYDARRRFEKHSQYTHDIVLRTLADTGLIGFGLFATVVVALAVGLIGARRELGALGRGCAVASLAIAAYFLVHASLDWLEEFPALAAPALALPLAVIAMRTPGAPRPLRFGSLRSKLAAARSRPAVRVGTQLATVLAGAILALALIPPYLASRYVARAVATYKARPAGAYDDLARAQALNPLSADAITSEGAIAVQLGDAAGARAAFTRALARQNDWYPRLELALLDAEQGSFSAGLQELGGAAKLDVDDPLIAQARTMMEHRQRIDPVEFNQLLDQGPQASFFAPENIK